MQLFCILLTLAICMLPAASWAAHPYEQLESRDPAKSLIFAGTPISLPGIGEVRFDFDLPDAESLSPAERYIVAGAASRTGDSGLEPWWQAVLFMAIGYESSTGRWPAAISDEVIETVAGSSIELVNHLKAELKSPITGSYPRLDAVSFSPGDLYLRRLTRDEVQTLTSQGATMLSNAGQAHSEPVSLPFYIRIYGERNVLAARYAKFGVSD